MSLKNSWTDRDEKPIDGGISPHEDSEYLAYSQVLRDKASKRYTKAVEAQNKILKNNAIAMKSVIEALKNNSDESPSSADGRKKRTRNRETSAKNVQSLRILGIMDEFTASAFEVSCDLLRPNLMDWKLAADDFEPDLLLVESAWNGNDGQWHKKIDRVSPELTSLVEWCREHKIPTVFWNKEDPVHYNGFISTATLFDYVFTTDISSVRRYKRELGHSRVYLMPFFCEPGLHSPLHADRQVGSSFAGAYYKRYKERSENFDALIAGVESCGPITIFDRNYGNNLPEFDFPERYQNIIAGGLDYNEIQKSYKGFEFGINLNSVKQSQSMFARRVFDLILSNTHVVSNYSLGLRLLFGDLVVSSDDAGQINQRVGELLGQRQTVSTNPFAAYIRLLALRKVQAEHTTQDRLAYMASRIWVDAPTRDVPKVAVIARIREVADAEALVLQFKQQTWQHRELILLIDDVFGVGIPPQHDGIRYILHPEANIDVPTVVDAPFVAVWNAAASYGPYFLQDALRAFEFGDLDGVTRVPTKDDLLGLQSAFTEVDSASVLSSVWRTSAMPTVRLGMDMEARISGLRTITLPSFDYAEPGYQLTDTSIWDAATDTGLPLASLLREAEIIEQEEAVASVATGWAVDALLEQFPESRRNGEVQVRHSAGGLLVSSTLPAEKHRYVYALTPIPYANLLDGEQQACLHLVTLPGAATSLVILFLDSEGERIGSQVVPANSNVIPTAPDNTHFIHIGLRIQGSGICTIVGLSFEPLERANTAVGVLSVKSQLLVTNVYPTYGDLYRNGFVHSRVRTYHDAGLQTMVYVLNKNLKPGTYEFEGVDVQVGGEEELAATIKVNEFSSVLVHFLDPAMWSVLQGFIDSIPVIVWIHGAEIQPWHRRDFNYTTEAEREQAKRLSLVRTAFWEEVFSYTHPNLHFVLVSRYFAEEVMSDVGIRLPESRYSVIHNYVDTDLFKYSVKDSDHRYRILSIRPFASRKYANDLTVAAILHLVQHPSFSAASFLIVGDGVLFEDTLEPLKGLNNVEIRRGFLTQSDIASLHKDYGIFMSPTRMDSQGVSRDEAMSSGLVPVTTAVTAIPEFVDDSCGILAPAEDAAAMAKGIKSLWDNPNEFLRMSEAASERVYRQSRREQTIEAEVELIRRRSREVVEGLNITQDATAVM